MTRRISCYVVFVTLIWGAHTQDDEKGRDMFKSNMTRNDFSNLLQSLIKLNEQRVSVLQKLYRLEDYGVLSEVLRSGDKKTENGDPNNMFLIVMSKNENDQSRRKLGFQLMDSVTPLNVGSSDNNPKLQFVLDPAGYIPQNNRKENGLESLFGNFPNVGPASIQQADSGNNKISATKKSLKFDKAGLKTVTKYDSNILGAATGLKANESRKHQNTNSRFQIVSNQKLRSHASEKLLDYNGNSKEHPQTVGYNSQSNEYLDFTTENDKLTTKPIIKKHLRIDNHQNSKYHSPQLTTKSNIIKHIRINNHQNSKYHLPQLTSEPNIIKHIRINNHQNSKYHLPQLTTKPNIIKIIRTDNHQNSKYPLKIKDEDDEAFYGSPFVNVDNDNNRQYTKMISDIFVEKHHNHPKTNKYTPHGKSQSNQKKNKLTTKTIVIKYLLSSNPKNSKYPLEGKEQDEDNFGSPFNRIKNNHNRQYTIMFSDVSAENLYGSNHKTNKNTPKVKVQSNREKYKQMSVPIKIKDILFSNNKKTKYLLEGKEELNEDYYGSPFSDIENDYSIPIKKLHVKNHNNPITDKNIPKINVQRNQHPKLNLNELKLNNQGNKYFKKKKAIKRTTLKNDYRINGTASENYQVFKIPNLTNGNTNLHDLTFNANDNKFSSLAIETAKDRQYASYPDFEDHKDVRDNFNVDKPKPAKETPIGNYPGFGKLKDFRGNANKNKPKTTIGTPSGNYPDFENLKDIRDSKNKDILQLPTTVKDTPDTIYRNYPGFENLKDVRNNSNIDKPTTAKDTPLGNNPDFDHYKDVGDNSNKNMPNAAISTPSGNFHGFEHHKHVMENLNKDKPNTAKELHNRDNLTLESKKDAYESNYGVKMFDNGKGSAEEFSILITNVGNGTAEEVKQPNDPKLNPNAFGQPESKPIARKHFTKCLTKKAIKLCCKSCISSYKNVCRRLKCSSRSQKALKSECKRSCKKTFASSSSKYSDDEKGSHESDSDDDYS